MATSPQAQHSQAGSSPARPIYRPPAEAHQAAPSALTATRLRFPTALSAALGATAGLVAVWLTPSGNATWPDEAESVIAAFIVVFGALRLSLFAFPSIGRPLRMVNLMAWMAVLGVVLADAANSTGALDTSRELALASGAVVCGALGLARKTKPLRPGSRKWRKAMAKVQHQGSALPAPPVQQLPHSAAPPSPAQEQRATHPGHSAEPANVPEVLPASSGRRRRPKADELDHERRLREHAEAMVRSEREARHQAESRAAEASRLHDELAARIAELEERIASRANTGHALNGRWEILPEPPVGGGAFGFIFRVRNLRPEDGGPEFAVAKLITADPAAALTGADRMPEANEHHRERLIREIELTADLESPYIVEVHDGGYDRNLRITFLVMTYYEAGSLDEFLRQYRYIEVDRVLALGQDLFSGLAYLHERSPQIVHRDLKPQNILLRDDLYSAVICDFSISRISEIARETITQGQVVLSWFFTPLDQRPSPANPSGLPHPSVDVYAAGACLYAMCTGLAPYERHARAIARRQGISATELLRSRSGLYWEMLTDPEIVPPRADEVDPSVPAELADLISACLDPVPPRRPKPLDVLTRLAEIRATTPAQWLDLQTSRRREPDGSLLPLSGEIDADNTVTGVQADSATATVATVGGTMVETVGTSVMPSPLDRPGTSAPPTMTETHPTAPAHADPLWAANPETVTESLDVVEPSPHRLPPPPPQSPSLVSPTPSRQEIP